jgi:outer membrane immunogenic protein
LRKVFNVEAIMRLSGIALLALLAGTAATNAADLNWNSNATSPMFSATSVAQWTGFYAGVNGGYAFGQTEIEGGVVAGSATGGKHNSGGFNLGAQAGYNLDMGGFVLGGEADVQFGGPVYKETLSGGEKFEQRTEFFSTVRARAGIPVGQVMPFATLGVAFGRGAAEIKSGPSTTTTNANHFGWTAGVGLEAQATQNLSFKAEYLYVDLGTQAYGIGTASRDVTQRFSVVRAGVNYRF